MRCNESLFKPVVPEGDLDPKFRGLLHPYGHAPTRESMQAAFDRFPNPDGNFGRDFQTTGFDARVWELYLFAWGDASGYSVTRPHDRPDFLFTKDLRSVWIEAVTANPTPGQSPPEVPEPGDPGFLSAMRLLNDNFVPIKLGSPLFSKVKARYWEQSHVAGMPFVLAIEDFHDPAPVRDSSHPLAQYLYGKAPILLSGEGEPLDWTLRQVKVHRVGSKKIPSGFFFQPATERVSAVLFSNSGTVAKFGRMGYDPERHNFLKMVRYGTAYNPDASALVPKCFAYVVGDGSYEEPWGEGIEIFHNPQAKIPLPPDFFRGSAEHWLIGGKMGSTFPAFHPYCSITRKWCEKDGRPLGNMALFQDLARKIREKMESDRGPTEDLARELMRFVPPEGKDS